MENYIVRIYDRDPADSNSVTGILESVEQETRQPFRSIDALRSLLSSASAEESRTAAIPPTANKAALSRAK